MIYIIYILCVIVGIITIQSLILPLFNIWKFKFFVTRDGLYYGFYKYIIFDNKRSIKDYHHRQLIEINTNFKAF